MNELDLESIQQLFQDLYVNRQSISDVSSVSEVKYQRKTELTDEKVQNMNKRHRSNTKR